jgi:hypothetical protein
MRTPTTLRKLTALFERLGARDPGLWAESQLDEGIPQLARYLFLREAWRRVVSEDDRSWIDQEFTRARFQPDEPFSGIGHALRRLRARGASDADLTDLVRGMQVQLLHNLCYLLGDSSEVEAEVSDCGWTLVQTDEEGTVKSTINGLHESVLDTDPTGREMRPRPKPRTERAEPRPDRFDGITVHEAGNTLAPALAVLRAKGFTVERIAGDPGWFEARRAGCRIGALDTIALLGIAAIVEARGPDWQPTDAEVDAYMELDP